MKQISFLFTLFMAIVMMAMCPQMMKADNPDYFCITAGEDATSFGFVTSGNLSNTPCLEYSTDNCVTWNDFVIDGTLVTLDNAGDKVYFRAGKTTDESYTKNESFCESAGSYIYVHTSNQFSVSGNIMSLLDQTMTQTSVPQYAFYRFFSNCTNLITAPELPATTLSEYCYAGMFVNCSSLSSPVILPASTLAEGCYNNMFSGCKKLSAVYVNFTEWNADDTNGWMYNVAETGTLYCPSDLAVCESGESTYPSAWLQLSVSPTNGSTLNCLNNVSFTISNSYGGVYWHGDITAGVETDKITITDENGNSMGAKIIPYRQGRTVGFKCGAILADGTYTVTIPANNIIYEYSSGTSKTVESDFVAYFTIENGVPPLDNITFNPSNTAVLRHLDNVSYTFNDYTVANWGPGLSANVPTDKIIVKKGDDVVNVKVTPGYGSSNNQLELGIDDINEEGTYTIIIPAGCVKLCTAAGTAIYPTTEPIETTIKVHPVPYVTDIQDGQTVDKISSITLTFTGVDGLQLTGDEQVNVYDQYGNYLTRATQVKVEDNKVMLKLESEITDAGKYTIYAPYGISFSIDDGQYNDLNVSYDFKMTLQIGDYNTIDLITIPENGEIVHSINSIYFQADDDYELTVNNGYTPVITKNGVKQDVTFNCDAGVNVLSISCDNTITTPGKYKVILPAGMLTYNGETTTFDVVVNLTVVPVPSVKLNSEGYATYSSNCPVTVTTEGIKAYTARIIDDEIRLEEIPSNGIDSDLGVILYGENMPEATVNFVESSGAVTPYTVYNALKPTTTFAESIVAVPTDEGTVWSLGADDNFYKYSGTTFKANRAYLVHDLGLSAKMRMVFADDITGIQSVNADTQDQSGNALVYNLNGQRVNANAKGIILRNGHKYFNK